MFGGGQSFLLLLIAAAAATATAAAHVLEAPTQAQQVLNVEPQRQGNPRKLKGRFLHITDFHPDPFYKVGADFEGEHPCHQGKGVAETGYYGATTTECDSPFTLINATFEWIQEYVKDEIDFIIWTGDSARHDNDDDIPRSDKQIEDLNKYLVSKFVEVFGKSDNINDPDPTNDFVIPIVPTWGNNDILPHNIFAPGPNRWTKKYLDIWAKFVPEEQRHSFARGGWFFTEVIPNKLAVFSLNTLYFFNSNAAVDGCDLESEPGYEHMEFLRIQLQFLRERKMKAILIGHVPPARTESKESWDETCYQKYTLWQRQYRDVIIANLYGHMNIDHFMFQDVRDLTYKFKIDGIDDENLRSNSYEPDPVSNDEFHAQAKADYINELRAGWATLPVPPKGTRYSNAHSDIASAKKGRSDRKERQKFLKEIGGPWAERFSMSLVSPSVVPNFFPTMRIVEYNMTGLEHDHPASGRPLGVPASESDLKIAPDELYDEEGLDDVSESSDIDTDIDTEKKKRKKKKGGKKKPVKPYFPVPKPPSKTTRPGPAYSPQTFSFLSWTQLYANLTEIHHKMSQKSEQSASEKKSHDSESGDTDRQKDYIEPQWLIDARKKAKGREKLFDFKVEYVTDNDTVIKMPDLLLRSWLDLAERIGRTEYSKRPKMTDEDEDDEGYDYIDATVVSSVDERDIEYQDRPSSEYDVGTISDTAPEMKTEIETDIDADEDTDIQKSKKKHKKKKKKNKGSRTGKLKKNHLWHTFVKRVFVQTKSEKDLEDDFD